MVRALFVLGLSLIWAGCASTGAVPRPFPLPGGPSSSPPPGVPSTPSLPKGPNGTADGYSISATALALRGVPYRNGGADPSGFDCSGLVKYVFEQHGVAMPREARRQFDIGSDIDTSSLEPGDLVFFTTVAPGASHVGIVVGGDQFVHAPASNGVVRVEHLGTEYWRNRFIGARRIN